MKQKLIAMLTDTAALRLEEQATRSILGDHHYIAIEGGVILVCFPPRYTAARNFLVSFGALVLPPRHDPVNTAGEKLAAASGGVISASDTGFAAAQKLHEHHKWPLLDPHE